MYINLDERFGRCGDPVAGNIIPLSIYVVSLPGRNETVMVYLERYRCAHR